MKDFSKDTLLIVELIVVLLCFFIIMVGLWAVDIGVSGMIYKAQTGVELLAGNGYEFRNACQQYHNGLYLVFAGIILLCILCFFIITDKRYRLDKKQL